MNKNKFSNIAYFKSGEKKQSKVSIKIFATQKRMYQSKIKYICNGKTVQTEWLGSPSGEDVVILADEGSDIRIISGYGKATHFKTDDTFSEKVNVLSDHILIRVPEAAGRQSMFVIDAHLGKAHQVVRDICLAFGNIVGTAVGFDEEMAKEDVA